MAQIKVSVVAYGFASLLVVLGVILLIIGYNYSSGNPNEISAGWTLITVGILVYIAGFVLRVTKAIR